jgi:hypothetical protein
MWMLFHRKAGTKVVRGGESFVETCPECGKRATFHEVEVSESYGVFFVDVVGDKERAFKCGSCGETFDLKDRPQAAPSKSLDDLVEEARLEDQRRLALAEERQLKAEAKAVRIEDELAELKKRLGR